MEIETASKCEGICGIKGTCRGKISRYEITDYSGLHSPWIGARFNYCETAVREDRSRGFSLKAIEE